MAKQEIKTEEKGDAKMLKKNFVYVCSACGAEKESKTIINASCKRCNVRLVEKKKGVVEK